MKKSTILNIFLLVFLLNINSAIAQVAINETNSNPDASAILDIQSTNKGVLIPRISTLQRTSINAPATGLVVFDTDTQSFWFKNANTWSEIQNPNITKLADADSTTSIYVEQIADEDIIRMHIDSLDKVTLENSTKSLTQLSFPNNQNNVLLGTNAGIATTTGKNNVAIGHQAGQYNTTGNHNTLIGYRTGQRNTTGYSNTFMGYNAGQRNTTGYSNTYMGYGTGENTNTESEQVFIGNQAGAKQTTGISNTFIGNQAGYNSGNNYAAEKNTFIGNQAGYSALKVYENTFIGHQSGYNHLTAYYNTYIGYQAGYSTSSGMNSTLIGHQAGYLNLGSNNTFVGYQAGYSNKATDNTFIGYQAGYANTTGEQNMIQGYEAGHSSTTGDKNVLYGYKAGYANTTGERNLIIGSEAGQNYVTSDNNVIIGAQAGYSATSGTGNVFIGYQAGYYETGSDKLYIENTNSTTPLIYGDFANDTVKIHGQLKINKTTSYTLSTTDGLSGQTISKTASGIGWTSVHDNLGSHIATQNIQLNNNWFSNDGDSEGIFIETDGKVKFSNNIQLNNNWLSNDGDSEGVFVETDGKVGLSNNLKLNDNWLSNDGDSEGIFIETDGKISLTNNLKLNNNWLSNDGDNEAVFIETNGSSTFYSNIKLNNKWLSNDGDNEGIYVSSTGFVTMNKPGYVSNSLTGHHDFIFYIRNNSNNTSNYSNGLKITAGADNYSSATPSRYISFYKPDGSFIGSIRQDGSSSVKYVTSSDVRLKTNIKPTVYGLANLMQVQAVDYHFKNDLDNVLTGFLAQDLYQHFPEAVSEGGEDANENPWTVDYGRVTPLLVKAAQEQQSIIETHQTELDKTSKKLNQLETGITKLNTTNASILQRLDALENTSTSTQIRTTK